MNRFTKYAGAALLTGALAVAAATPGQARSWHHGGWHGAGAAAAIGFGAGALIGAAAANNYYDGYAYAPGPDYYAPGYAYDQGYAYAPAYAYEPAPTYGYEPAPGYAYSGNARYGGSRSVSHSQGAGCIQSPGSMNYTSCN